MVLKDFFNKMNNCMLWAIVAPMALLIFAFSLLVGAYTVIIWRSDHLTVEGAWGKITTVTNHLKNQNTKAITYNQELADTTNQLSQLLNKIQLDLSQSAAYVTEDKSIKNIFTSMSKNLKQQSEFLTHQKEELEAIDQDLIQFQNKLKNYVK